MGEGITERIIAVLDRLAPVPHPDSREGRRRARLVVAASLIGCAILTSTALSSLALGLDGRLATLNLAWTATVLCVVYLARWFRSTSLLANALVAMGFAHTLLLGALAGGRNIGALFGLSVFPLVAVLLAGWRSGLVFTALSAAGVLLTPLVPSDLLLPPHMDPAPVSPALVRDALNVVFAVGLLAALYDAVRSSTLRDAERSGARARLAAERQRQLIDLSRRLQEATIESFDDEIGRAMELAARLAGSDRTVLRLFEGRDYQGRFAWGEDGCGPAPELENVDVAARQYGWTASSISRGQPLQVRTLAELPPEAEAERTYLEGRRVVSWLCIPVGVGRTAIGYQCFETTSREKVWDDEVVAALRLMTDLLAATVLRHRTERALRESEKKFAAAFRNHPDAMVITDLETDEILECNERWLELFRRRSREQVIGRRPTDFELRFPQRGRESFRRALWESGRSVAAEIPVVGPEGEPRTFLVSAIRIDIGGRPCVLANVHDLTDRKQLEQQLLHAQKMEAVGRLAGGIAHDYNNMLTVISGYSAGLSESLEGELREDAEEIHRAAQRSADLTRQLLAFSRRQVLQTEVLDPNALLSGLEAMLRPLIGESIRLELDLARSLPGVRSDRGQLEQAVVNLVVNGRDAMPDGGTLELTTSMAAYHGRDGAWPPDLAPGDYVVITVSDQGTGMDPELAEHVMEPFYTTKPEGQGTGLGLPMVHGLAQQCGGTLVLESEPGRGTRARIYLPAVHDAAATPTRSPRDASDSFAGGHRILLVEDEATVRRLAARTLRGAGHDVVEAADGAEALERARELGEAFDLVLSDVVMPRLSGIELVRRLREERSALPVVLMSGYPDSGESRPIPDDVHFLLKPFEPAGLREAVARALRAKRAEPPPASAAGSD